MWLGCPEHEITWEPASVLPASIIEEYEAGLVVDTSTECSNYYGHTASTIVVQKSTGEPATKKSRNERHIPKATEGLVLINTNMHYVVYDKCLNRLLLTLSVILLVFVSSKLSSI